MERGDAVFDTLSEDMYLLTPHFVPIYLIGTVEIGYGALISRFQKVDWKPDLFTSFPSSNKRVLADNVLNFSAPGRLTSSGDPSHQPTMAGLTFVLKGEPNHCKGIVQGMLGFPCHRN
jgi:hypothetical protein